MVMLTDMKRWITVIVLVVMGLGTAYVFTRHTEPVKTLPVVTQSTEQPKPHVLDVSDISKAELVNETNMYRLSNGIAPVAQYAPLEVSAQAKCNDIVTRNYWSHNTPSGVEPWVFIRQQGIKFHKAGENLAYGYKEASSVLDGWEKSPSHKENLLDSSFTYVGFAVCKSSNFMGNGPDLIVVQHFAG